MNTRELLTVLLWICLMQTACSNYGSKYEAGKNIEVYYTDSVDQGTAKRTGDFLSRNISTETRKSFQLTRSGEIFIFRMVVDRNKIKELNDQALQAFALLLSDSVFNNRPVDIELCDDHFKTIRSLPYR